MRQVEMKQVQKVLIFVIDGKLTAVELIKSATLGFKQQAHHQAQHQDVQLVVLVDGPHGALIQVEHCFRHVALWLWRWHIMVSC